MATLNVKNLPDSLYRRLQKRAKQQHRSVAQEVTKILDEALETPDLLSILTLRGLGKQQWTEIDAAAHVEVERKSWD
jgi:plasmid stability protein